MNPTQATLSLIFAAGLALSGCGNSTEGMPSGSGGQSGSGGGGSGGAGSGGSNGSGGTAPGGSGGVAGTGGGAVTGTGGAGGAPASSDAGPQDAPGSGASDAATPDGGGGGDSWATFAQGFFSDYCVSCHNDDKAGAATRDYHMMAVVLKEKAEIACGVAKSQADWSKRGCSGFPPARQFPVGSGPKPTDAQRDRILQWIDSGTP